MQKIFLFICLTTLSNLVFSQGKLEVFGTANGVKEGTEISISRVQPRFATPPSQKVKVIVNNGKFYFTTNQDGTEMYQFELLGKKKGFFFKTGKVRMSIPNSSILDAALSDDQGDRDYRNFLKRKDSISQKRYINAQKNWEDFVSSKNTDSIMRDKLWSGVKRAKKEYDKHAIDSALHWIAKNPKSSINAVILNNFLLDIVPNDQLTDVYNTLPNDVKNNSWGRDLHYKINNLFVGGTAPYFEQTDTSNTVIKLSDFTGQYVLVDFWATWCIPCRAETPGLIKAKQLLPSDIFQIISISLDSKEARQKWLDIIKLDKMDWVHLSTLNTFQNDVALKYHIKTIPSSFLISPDGKILARNVSGENLYKIVENHWRQM